MRRRRLPPKPAEARPRHPTNNRTRKSRPLGAAARAFARDDAWRRSAAAGVVGGLIAFLLAIMLQAVGPFAGAGTLGRQPGDDRRARRAGSTRLARQAHHGHGGDDRQFADAARRPQERSTSARTRSRPRSRRSPPAATWNRRRARSMSFASSSTRRRRRRRRPISRRFPNASTRSRLDLPRLPLPAGPAKARRRRA